MTSKYRYPIIYNQTRWYDEGHFTILFNTI